MKKLFFVLAGVLSLLTCYSQQWFTVKIRMDNPNNYPLRLQYRQNDKWVEDSIYTVKNGIAIFRGRVSGPDVASLTVKGNPEYQIHRLQSPRGYMQGPPLSFVLSNETIQIEGDVNRLVLATVNGGKINEEWNKLKEQENKFIWETWSALKEYDKEGDDKAWQRATDLRTTNNEKVEELQNVFIEQHPHSFVSLYLLSRTNRFEELRSAYAKADEIYKNSSFGKRVAERIKTEEYQIKALEATAAGMPAIPIQKPDINGKPLTLESLKGKYVLLDFWGSWCGPCRKSHPHLKEVYTKYKDKGFEILGISYEKPATLEEQKKLWKEAVQEDGLPWLQVLNSEGQETCDLVKLYGVSAFPTKFLLDKEGRIIGRFRNTEEDVELLDKKFKEIFGY